MHHSICKLFKTSQHYLVQERCIAAVERANGAEAREAALAEEKAQLKAGMKVAFSRQEELEESLAAATSDTADLRTQVDSNTDAPNAVTVQATSCQQ